MKENNEEISVEILCKYLSISRQAYYKHEWDLSKKVFQSVILLDKIKNIRNRCLFSQNCRLSFVGKSSNKSDY